MEININELTVEAFAPYGSIIHNPEDNIDYPAPTDDILTCTPIVPEMVLAPECLAQMLVCKSRPMEVEKVECHKDSAEILLSTKGEYVLCVAPAADKPELDKMKAFRVPEGSTVVMKEACWHWIPFPTGEQDAEAIVIFRKDTVADDLIFADLEEKVVIK